MTTKSRLEAYYAAEAEILEAQEMRGADRSHRMAELEEVRQAIKDLEVQLAREQHSGGRGGLRYSLANLSRR